ncbi:MAG: hypothetical protein ACOYK1_00630 [Vampirovibrionia bacterium]
MDNFNINISSVSLSLEQEQEILESLKDKEEGKVKTSNPRSASFHESLIEFAESD